MGISKALMEKVIVAKSRNSDKTVICCTIWECYGVKRISNPTIRKTDYEAETNYNHKSRDDKIYDDSR